jgi:lysophospholipase L1-like esterase
VYEGVNDVWHKTSGTGTDLDKYEKFYVAVIKKLQANKAKLILVTPACIGEMKDNKNAQDEDLNKYCDVIRKLASTYNCGIIDFRKMMQAYETANNNENKDRGLLTTDKVHLTPTGNQMLADALMKELGM